MSEINNLLCQIEFKKWYNATVKIEDREVQLKKLKSDGTLRRVGPNKGGHWEIIKE